MGCSPKPTNVGIPTYIMIVIQSSFRVFLVEQSSSNTIIPAVVPQGSMLAPSLFMIYLSDIPTLPQGCELFLFADDTAIAVKGRTVNELKNRAQQCVGILIKYIWKWKITPVLTFL